MRIESSFYDNQELACAFFDAQRVVYPGLDLQWANDHHLLRPQVTPFSLINGDGKTVSILNASLMRVHIKGKDFRSVQIGTVATLPEFRSKGFAANLQQYVQEHYAQLVDFQFLFANPSVLDFYPKFGFEGIEQSSYHFRPIKNDKFDFTRLTLDDEGIAFLKSGLSQREPTSDIIDARDAGWLVEFYCRRYYSQNLWVNQSRNVILVASVEGSILELHDIIALRHSKDFFQSFSWPGISEIKLGFTPDKFEGPFEIRKLPTDEQIFVRGNFPAEMSDFKFPTLAIT